MALSLVQHKTNSGTTGSTVSVTVTALTAGNLVVVGCAGSSSGSISSISDGGNTYSQVASTKATEAGGRFSDIWSAKNVSGGSTSVTVTFSTTGVRMAVEVWEVSGADTSSPVDAANNGTGTTDGSNHDTGPTVTTSTADTFIAAIVRTSGAVSGESGTDAVFTLSDLMGGGGAASSVIVASTGTYGAIWSDVPSGSSFASSIAAFKIAAAGGGPTVTYPDLEKLTRGLERGLMTGVIH